MSGGGGLLGPGLGLDRVSPGMVIDVASLILQVIATTHHQILKFDKFYLSQNMLSYNLQFTTTPCHHTSQPPRASMRCR